MYRDLDQVKLAADEPSIPASAVRNYGVFTLFNTRAFLIQLMASQVPNNTLLEVYLNVHMSPGTSKYPTKPSLTDNSLWTLIHSNTALSTVEPLIYEKTNTAAEWLRFRVTAGNNITLDNLDIVLSRQAWR